MASFSERQGLKPVRTFVQKEQIDDALANYLWNALHIFYFQERNVALADLNRPTYNLIGKLWTGHFERVLDEMPRYTNDVIIELKSDFFGSSWNEMLDFIEFVPQNFKSTNHAEEAHVRAANRLFYEMVNTGLAKYVSAYRFVAGEIVEITSEEEIIAIETAIAQTSALTAVQSHLTRAVELYADREMPDYRNSIKESISAVESIAKRISGGQKDTLAASLDKIKGKLKIHKGLEQGFKNIYGYTSDDSGIRHALTDDSSCDAEDAKFMLVACSAFVNYLLVKADKAGIPLD